MNVIEIVARTSPLQNSRLRFGTITLNRPKALNSINLDMIVQIDAQLRHWQQDPQIAFVVLTGEGDRAFCAGGDVTALYRAMSDDSTSAFDPSHYAYRFFNAEYRLNALIHHYTKPIVALGHHVIMGGGVGLFMGASHKVVFPSTRYAMPETGIGLYPDVGGTWLLSRLPQGVGEFIALTGTTLSGQDCYFLGLADLYIEHEVETILHKLGTLNYLDDISAAANLNRLFHDLTTSTFSKPSSIATHFDVLRQLACHDTVAGFLEQVEQSHQQKPNAFLEAGLRLLREASPLSLEITWWLLRHNRRTSVLETLQRDFWVSLMCCDEGDVKEGVRARLIDKDKRPKWRYSSTIDQDVIELFCQPRWTGKDTFSLTT